MDNPEKAISEALVITDGELYDSWETVLSEQEGHYLTLADEQIYPGVRNLGDARDVYYQFMRGNVKLKDIALEKGIDERTVLKWAATGDWIKRRQGIEDVSLAEEEQRLNRIRMEQREPTLMAQLAAGERVMGKVAEMATDEDVNYKPSELKMLSEALKNTIEGQHKALGITDTGIAGSPSAKKKEEEANGKKPLVVVVKGAGLPEMRQAEGSGATENNGVKVTESADATIVEVE